MDIVSRGHFIGSMDKMDCTYCDFRPICGDDAADRTKAKKPSNPVEFGVVDRLKEYE